MTLITEALIRGSLALTLAALASLFVFVRAPRARDFLLVLTFLLASLTPILAVLGITIDFGLESLFTARLSTILASLQDFAPWILGFGAVGALAGWSRIATSHLHVARIRQRAERLLAPRWIGLSKVLARDCQLPEDVPLFVSKEVATPFAMGWHLPSVVLTESSLAWSDGELQSVLLHELIHLRRDDTGRKLIIEVLRALWWWHPAASYVAKRIGRSTEEACDAGVIRTGIPPSMLASAVLRAARIADPLPRAVPCFGTPRGRALEARLEVLLAPPASAWRRWPILVVAALFCLLPLLALQPKEQIPASDHHVSSAPTPR